MVQTSSTPRRWLPQLARPQPSMATSTVRWSRESNLCQTRVVLLLVYIRIGACVSELSSYDIYAPIRTYTNKSTIRSRQSNSCQTLTMLLVRYIRTKTCVWQQVTNEVTLLEGLRQPTASGVCWGRTRIFSENHNFASTRIKALYNSLKLSIILYAENSF